MKFTLTITDASVYDLHGVLAALNAGAAQPSGVILTPAPAPIVSTNDDDDTSGDTAAAPGTVDSSGLPWDDRIHSTPATLTKKGVWRARRGVDPATVSAVEAELRKQQAMPQQPVPAPQPAPVVPATPVTDAAAAVQQPPVNFQPAPQPMQIDPATVAAAAIQPQQPVPAPQPAPVAPAVPVAPAAPVAGLDFNAFMQRISVLLTQRDAAGNALIDANYLASVTQRVGQAFNAPLSVITDVAPNQQWIDYAVQIIAADGRWR